MREGAWIEAETGRWHWIDEHADWIRRPECARSAGLPEDVVQRLAAMPRRELSGHERNAILLEAMHHGLIRFRGHGGRDVTIESTSPLSTAIRGVARFMAENFGPLTLVRFNQLPDGPCIAIHYQELALAIERGGLAALLPHDQGAQDSPF
jgi:hypothetical protein